MPLTVAMLSWETMHSIAIGGLAPHVTELSAGLRRRGHEVHVFTRVGMGQSRYDCVDGVHYHRCPFEPHADFLTYVSRMCDSFVWHLAETESYLGRPFDVVHGHDWLSTWALAQVKNRHHHPSVFTVHSTEFGRCGNSVWDDPMSRRIRDLEWEGTYVADRVICVSKTLRDETQRLYDVPADKIFPIYNGVDAHKYNGQVDVAAIRNVHGVGVDDPFVLFAGRLTWQKGPDILMEAVPDVLESFPRTKFIFAGDGDMRPGLESRAKTLGINGAARFLGHCKGRELVDLFKASDLVCVPSRNEPFGIVILEAWSASKPVVATRIGGPTEFVRHAYNGLTVDPGIEPIGRGISELLSDMPGAREMGRKGRIEAESRFSWDHSAAETEKVYHSIVPHRLADRTLAGTSRNKELQGMINQSTDKTNSPVADTMEGKVKSMAVKDVASKVHPTEEAIRRRAYEIYVARGATPGDPMADWLQAEREIRAGKTTAPAAPAGKRK